MTTVMAAGDIAPQEPVVAPPTDSTAMPSLRRWITAVIGTIVVFGMAYSLWWFPVVRHVKLWKTTPDMWNTMVAARLFAFGGAAGIYRVAHIDTFPGLALLMAPVARVSDALHLSWSYPLPIAHPTAWLLVGPVEMLLGALVLFPLDACARRLRVSRRRRMALLFIEAVGIWPVLVDWGHPEDLLGLGCALYGLLAVVDGRRGRAAWWLGAAVAFQPLVLLVVPLALVWVPLRRWLVFGVTIAIPSAVLLVDPLVHTWAATIHAIGDQPSFPGILWPTPWIRFASHLGTSTSGVVLNGGSVPVRRASEIVAAGPERLLALVAAIGIAVVVARLPRRLDTLLWAAALCLAMRCLFDSVLVPYYFAPALLVSLVVAGGISWRRTACLAAVAAGLTRYSYVHASEWVWYLVCCGLLLVACSFAYPSPKPSVAAARAEPGGDGPSADPSDGVDVDRSAQRGISVPPANLPDGVGRPSDALVSMGT